MAHVAFDGVQWRSENGTTLFDIDPVFYRIANYLGQEDRRRFRLVSRAARQIMDRHIVSIDVTRCSSEVVQHALTKSFRWPNVKYFSGYGSSAPLDIQGITCWNLWEFRLSKAAIIGAPHALSLVLPWWLSVRVLKIQYAGLGTESVNAIARAFLPCLEVLDLSGNYVEETAALSFDITAWPEIKKLFLRDVYLNDAGFRGICRLTGLEVLDISSNYVTSLEPVFVLQQLRSLNISSNSLAQGPVDSLKSIDALKQLDISLNGDFEDSVLNFALLFPNVVSLTTSSAIIPAMPLERLSVSRSFDRDSAKSLAATAANIGLHTLTFDRCEFDDASIYAAFSVPWTICCLHFKAAVHGESGARFSILSAMSHNIRALRILSLEDYTVLFPVIVDVIRNVDLHNFKILSVFEDYEFAALSRLDNSVDAHFTLSVLF